jgi:hypothetical protein
MQTEAVEANTINRNLNVVNRARRTGHLQTTRLKHLPDPLAKMPWSHVAQRADADQSEHG